MKTNQFKKVIALIMTGIMSLGMLTACAGGKAENAGGKKTIVMGTNAAFPPFEEVKGEDVVGFDPDIAKLIAADLGVELVIEDMEFASLINAVNTGKIDFIAAGMTATEERAKQVDFSQSYFKSKQVIIVNEGADTVAGPEDLVGKKVGVQLGTTGDLFVSGTEGVEVVQFDKAAMAVMELKNGKIDAVVVDEEPAKLIAQNQKGVILLQAPFIEEEYAIAVKKGNEELLNQINKVLEGIKEDGSYDKLYEQYFGKTE